MALLRLLAFAVIGIAVAAWVVINDDLCPAASRVLAPVAPAAYPTVGAITSGQEGVKRIGVLTSSSKTGHPQCTATLVRSSTYIDAG
jgi:hypothetical protein